MLESASWNVALLLLDVGVIEAMLVVVEGQSIVAVADVAVVLRPKGDPKSARTSQVTRLTPEQRRRRKRRPELAAVCYSPFD